MFVSKNKSFTTQIKPIINCDRWDMLSLLLISCLIASTIYIQSHSLLNWDVSYLMDAAWRFLQGGTYTHDFFETNPPMIFYLYLPPVLATKWFGLPKALSLLAYMIILFLGIVYLCQVLLKKLLPNQPQQIFLFLIVLSIVILLLPIQEFGQREHLLLLLSMPYLLLITARIQSINLASLHTVTIGLLAGCAFAIKPFFCLLPFILELFYWCKQTNKYTLLRPEIIAIGLVLTCYLLSLQLFFPDYITVITPLLLQLYYPGFGLPLTTLAFNEIIFVTLLFFITFLLWRRYTTLFLLADTLGVALLGYLILFFSEKTNWFYHLLPAFSIAILLCGLLIYKTIPRQLKEIKIKSCIFLSIFILFFAYGMYFIQQSTLLLLDDAIKGDRAKIIRFLRSYPQQTTWSLISTTAVIYPAFDYVGMTSVSRFPNYWWLPGIINLQKTTLDESKKRHLDQYMNYFISMVADDFLKNKPLLVFIDNATFNKQLNANNIDYIKLLSQNKNFRDSWQQYRLIMTFAEFKVYAYQGLGK